MTDATSSGFELQCISVANFSSENLQ